MPVVSVERELPVIECIHGAQADFVSSPAEVAFFCAPCGTGKTVGILLDAARYIDNAGYRAVIFTRGMIDVLGGLWDAAEQLYGRIGGQPYRLRNEWRFRSGAIIAIHEVGKDDELHRFAGMAVTAVYFDNLELFTEQQFKTLSRSARAGNPGMRPYVRGTCQKPLGWIAPYARWWTDIDNNLIAERSGVIKDFDCGGYHKTLTFVIGDVRLPDCVIQEKEENARSH